MYFSGLKKAIESLEEKRFYDIALLYLTGQGYKDVRIVDGPKDGGRDVVTSRQDLRIQLSVRKDWANKINAEAANALSGGKRHLLYITNRAISDKAAADFRANSYDHAGEVEVTIVDLKAITSSLSLPGIVNRAYEVLGIKAGSKVVATAADVALSSYLLFSNDAKELRQEIFECNIKACIYKSGPLTEDAIVASLLGSLPGANVEADIKKFRASLQSRGVVVADLGGFTLSPAAQAEMSAAEQEYATSIEVDISNLKTKYKLNEADARKLVEITLELVARGERVDGDDVYAVQLLDFLSDKGLNRRKADLFGDLSELSQARVKAYGAAVNHIFSNNTFDVYRALGKNSEIVMLLDSSVAMPMMFGLSFGAARSRYGLAASALHGLCEAHGISIQVPRCYLNEMASHGLKALDFVQEYEALDGEIKDFLKESGNAYLSHFSHIRRRGEIAQDFNLTRFLKQFGIAPGSSLNRVENTIESILDSHGISVIDEGRWGERERQAVRELKPNEPPILVDHDARVVTFLRSQIERGFIFSTWDNALIDVVEGLSRIFAHNPARVMDFLAMAVGSDYESRQSVSLLTTLLYIDDRKTEKLAKRIEAIRSMERVHELNELVRELRQSKGDDYSVEDVVSDFLTGLGVEIRSGSGSLTSN